MNPTTVIEGAISVVRALLWWVPPAGSLVAIAVSVAVALALERQKGRQAKDLERLRGDLGIELKTHEVRLDGLRGRVNSIQSREAEILPELWAKLCDVVGRVKRVTSPLKSQVDVGGMDEDVLEAFLQDSRFLPVHRDKLRRAEPGERQKLFAELSYFYDWNDAWNGVNDLHRYLERKKIYLEDPLYSELVGLDQVLWNALEEHQDRRTWARPVLRLDREVAEQRPKFDFRKLLGEIEGAKSRAERMIRDRMHFDDAA